MDQQAFFEAGGTLTLMIRGEKCENFEEILFKISDHDEPTSSMASQEVKLIQIPMNLPLPSPLVMTGNLGTNWKRFYRAWNNYEIAARLKDPKSPGTNKELRTATLLTCIGADALDVFDGLDFANEDERKDIDVIVKKLEKYCSWRDE